MKPAYYIIGLLLVFIMARECTRPNRSLTPSIQAHTDSISTDKARVADLQARGETIVQRLAKDSIRHLEALKRSESRVEGLTKSLSAALRRRPELRIDTVYILMDSVIQEQGSQITLLTHDRDTLRINYARLLRIEDAEIRIKDEMFSHMEAINSELFKNLNKERRMGKVWKVAVPVAAVVGFLIGEGL